MVDAPPRARMHWLDALRGIGAASVVLFHVSGQLPWDVRAATRSYFSLGTYGVVLFFLVSGFVIPMSLEWRADLRRFWVGRLCRLYPAYLVSMLLMAAVVAAGARAPLPAHRQEPWTAVLAHATMLTELVGVPGVVGVYWTLSYEMVFYLLIAGLFACGRSAALPWLAPALAAVALLVGPRLPDDLLGAGPGGRAVLAAALAALVAAVVGSAFSGRRWIRRAGGALGVAAVLLPAVNGSAGAAIQRSSWEAVWALAAMCAGVCLYRWRCGRLRPAVGGGLAAATLALVVAACLLHRSPAAARSDALTLAAVAATFALGAALRHRRVPRVLTWLGGLSYSLYLVHQPVQYFCFRNAESVLPGWRGSDAGRLAVSSATVAAILAVSWLSYRCAELPGQRLGHRWARRWPEPPLIPAPLIPAPRVPAPPPGGAARAAAPGPSERRRIPAGHGAAARAGDGGRPGG